MEVSAAYGIPAQAYRVIVVDLKLFVWIQAETEQGRSVLWELQAPTTLKTGCVAFNLVSLLCGLGFVPMTSVRLLAVCMYLAPNAPTANLPVSQESYVDDAAYAPVC